MTEQPAEKRVETVAVDLLEPDPDNARIHGIDLGLGRRSLDPGRLKRRQASVDDLRLVDSRALDEQWSAARAWHT